MRVKNNSGQIDTWCGQEIAIGGEYDVPAQDVHKWRGDDKVVSDVSSLSLLIGDAVSYKSTSSEAIDFLMKGESYAKDAEGAQLSRPKTTKTGWHYQPHWIEINTSELGANGFYNKDKDGNDLGFVTCKIYDVNDIEILLEANKGTAVKTVITWEPNHDYEVIASKLFQGAKPAEDVRIWVTGLPDIPYAYGGSRMFAQGGINLKFLGEGAAADTDGRSSKFLTYDAATHTNKFEIITKYSAGFSHSFAMLFEIYKQ